jgi:Fe-S oxidoreductase
MNCDPKSASFWSEEDLGGKLQQVTDVCHGCRRCLNLCPSFNVMFERIDASTTGEADGLVPADYRGIEDACYQCKLCYNHCPYTPPHRFDIDFPRLMLRAKAVRARKDGIRLTDRLMADPDRAGRLASRAAPLVNWVASTALGRLLMEKAVGIHRKFPLPPFVATPFGRWFRGRYGRAASPDGAKGSVALFSTCSVNYNRPGTGRAAVQVLLRNGLRVVYPDQVCCGMPALDGGDLASFERQARLNLGPLAEAVDEGCDIVTPGPTCSYVLKKEYTALVGGDQAEKVAARTYDLCEYLAGLSREGALDRSFTHPQGRIAYHLPCHLKSQNIGYKSRDLLSMIPGTTVEMVEACAGIDGTWGMRRENHDLALEVARPLFDAIRRAPPPDRVATDCHLAGLQIARGTGMVPAHPVEILRDAYGLEDPEPGAP